jgi:hypothetical protein
MRLFHPAALLLAPIPLGVAAAPDPTLRLNEKGYILALNAAIDLVAERP